MQGENGRLQTMIIRPERNPQGIAVLNHPNPLHGGSNINKVIQTAAKAVKNKGFICYLPNTRGTGDSDGEHDYGNGESRDLLLIIEAVRRAHPDLADNLILGGFSFGGYISARVAEQAHCAKLLLIAAAVNKYQDIAPPVPDADKTLFIQGASDDVVTLNDVLRWAETQNLPITVIPGAGHFFHGKLPLLQQTIERFL